MELIEAGGLKLAVTDEGAGTPILALHPFPLDGSVLERPAEALTRDRRVIRVDYPGFGQSPPPTGPVPLEVYARALREVLAQKKINRADGLGMSIGSYTLVELAKLAPMLFQRLVLASSRATASTPEARAEREAMARRTEAEGVSWLAAAWTPLLVRPDPERATTRLVEKIIYRATPQGVAAAARALAAREDQSAAAKAIQARTLVLHGGEDRITPVAEAERLAQLIPSSRLEIVPGAGHLIHLDEPDRFDRVVVSFLSD
jgi:pimeloyl-ACP methyl ester carboxylesterase